VALKSKTCVLQNWTNLEKRPPFPQFLSKLSEFFFGERSFSKSSKLLRAYFLDYDATSSEGIEGIQALSIPSGSF
jgi:hypothetical protein